METKVFKVGDRVAIYSSERMVGVVNEVEERGYWCFVDIKGKAYWQGLVHPKQLRRLKPKKRREFWIRKRHVNENLLVCSECPGAHPDWEIIRVREVHNDSHLAQKG